MMEIRERERMPGKNKKNKRTLKNKIRRIIYIVIFLIFGLMAIVYCWLAYYQIIFGTEFAANILGRTCSVLVDAEELKQVQNLERDNYARLEKIKNRLKDTLPELWNSDYLKFTIVKEINGSFISVIDNKENLFSIHNITSEQIASFKEENDSIVFQKGSTPLDNMAFTPIKDVYGGIVGFLGVQFARNSQIIIFFLVVLLIILLTIAGLFISLVVTRMMTMRITRPLEVLDNKIRMIARAEGDLSQRVIFNKTYKEVEDLAEGTNMVMESTGHFVRLLEEKQYRLEEKNRQLAHQAEELEYQTEELSSLNESLEEAMRQLQDAQVQLVQSEKMAALGQLTAGVAHEINTPLGAINSNTEIIEMVTQYLKGSDDVKVQYMIEKLDKANDTNKMACERIIQIVRHLKNFARLDESDFKEACLTEGLESVLLLSHNLLKHRITIHKSYGDIPMVKCFPNQLNQVFMNIIVNAAQAIGDQGDIWIKTWASSEKVYVQIRDNGEGIPEKNLHKIFDPGFTTKGVGVGTGLGLSICYKIVEKHKGQIRVVSKLGAGSTFTIELPVHNSFANIKQTDNR